MRFLRNCCPPPLSRRSQCPSPGTLSSSTVRLTKLSNGNTLLHETLPADLASGHSRLYAPRHCSRDCFPHRFQKVYRRVIGIELAVLSQSQRHVQCELHSDESIDPGLFKVLPKATAAAGGTLICTSVIFLAWVQHLLEPACRSPANQGWVSQMGEGGGRGGQTGGHWGGAGAGTEGGRAQGGRGGGGGRGVEGAGQGLGCLINFQEFSASRGCLLKAHWRV